MDKHYQFHFAKLYHDGLPAEHFAMNKRPTSVGHSSGDRGVALILTLAVLALVTLLLIAFVTSMRVENAASKNFNDLIKARELAQGAIDQAVAQIRQATPSRVPVGSTIQNYVTFPGGAYVYNGTALISYSLYSDPTLTDPTNLNSGLWITGGINGLGEFTSNSVPDTSQINVGWLYVDQNGNISPPPLSKPLVGRIGYWVDDEASKINVNTAGVPPACLDPPYNACSASNDVDLTMLLPSPFTTYAASIQSGAATQPYTTIQGIERANAAITNVFDDNRFEVTTYSNDANYPNYADDLDVFDRQRLVLNPTTLNANFATAVTELSDPNLALAKVYSSSGAGATFLGKYGPYGPSNSGLKQLIANIIGYQIDPTSTAPPTDGNPTTAPTYLGLTRSPLINQLQIEYDVTPANPPAQPTVSRKVTVTLLYMYSPAYNSRDEQIAITGLPALGNLSTTITFLVRPATINTGASYPVIYTDGPTTLTANPGVPGATPSIFYTRGYLLDYAQPTLPRNTSINITGGAFYQGAQVVGDPAVHETATPSEWTSYPALPAPPSGYPGANDISKVVMRAAPMLSVGELGYIHLPGIAYGHLKLQPGGGNITAGPIPDWALLDLFTVGAGAAGRININSCINPPFANITAPGPVTQRLVPLKALLSGAGINNIGSVSQSIYEDEVSDRGTFDYYGMAPAERRYGIFDTIGEICEIGSLTTANGVNTQAGMEAAIRRIANLITVRSNTFTIWVLAQSIKQPPGSTPGTFTPGTDLITGEVKAQAVVERYESTPGSAPKYRLRYLRYLNN
jgi:hypothetical protein